MGCGKFRVSVKDIQVELSAGHASLESAGQDVKLQSTQGKNTESCLEGTQHLDGGWRRLRRCG